MSQRNKPASRWVSAWPKLFSNQSKQRRECSERRASLLQQLEDRRMLAVASLPDHPLPLPHESVYLAGGNFDNNPTGELNAPIYYNSGASTPTSVVIADLVGGPQADIAIGHADGSVTFLEGSASGEFTLRGELTVAANLGAITSLAASDFDGDGTSELVVAATSGVVTLTSQADPLPQSPIVNGTFDAGLTGWTASAIGQPATGLAGRITATSGFAAFSENQSFLTTLSQRVKELQIANRTL